jgi:hypothetical protein
MLGMMDTRKSMARPGLHLEAPVLGHAPLGDVELGQHLEARHGLLGQGRAGTLPVRLSTPSTRYLMTSPPGWDSRWMSLAPWRMAS